VVVREESQMNCDVTTRSPFFLYLDLLGLHRYNRAVSKSLFNQEDQRHLVLKVNPAYLISEQIEETPYESYKSRLIEQCPLAIPSPF